ncbi:MFS transporter [Thalassospira sp. MA62]|nr:MFS transporter [Thalassospira sp. MA62]
MPAKQMFKNLKVEPVVHTDGLPHPRRIYAAFAILITITMAVLDGTIMNVALPTIAQDQGASPAHTIWVVTGYQLAIVVALLPLSALGEAIGFRKVYLSGIAIFGFSSALCAGATSIEYLIAARVLQGLGAAAIMCINAAMMRHVFPQAKLGQAIGWIAMTVSVSAAAGPTIASGVLAVTSWHWLFLINVPISIISVIIGYVSLPFNANTGARFDYISAILNVLTFGGLVAALGNIGIENDPKLIIAQFAVAIVGGMFLVHRQLSRTRPMLPIDLLKLPIFACSIGSSLTGFCAQMIAFITLPFYFHDVLGHSATITGLLMTPWPVATAFIAPLAGRMADKVSPIRLTGIGMGTFAVGLYSTTLAADMGGNVAIIAALALCGAGFGLFQAPNNRLMMTSAPKARAGGASGMLSTARLTGQSVGAAIAAILIGTGGGFELETIMWCASGSAIASALICEGRRLALRSGLIANAPGA